MLHTLRFSLQNAVYFKMLFFLVHTLFTFYIQSDKEQESNLILPEIMMMTYRVC